MRSLALPAFACLAGNHADASWIASRGLPMHNAVCGGPPTATVCCELACTHAAFALPLSTWWDQASRSSLYELLSVLPSQLQTHVDSADDRTFLHAMFRERSLHSLIKIHERLQQYEECCPTPVLDRATSLAQGVSRELQATSLNAEVKELLKLLSNPYMESLLSVHDTVAQKTYEPQLPPLPDDIDDDEDSVKIIRLVKSKEPLGATIKRDEHTGAVTIARIMRGGAADRSGLIHVGDELKEVNGIPVDDKQPEDIIHILAQSQGAITFKVVPGMQQESPAKEPKMYVRALFDYNPEEDKAIPCKEAGLAFRKGDILQVMCQDDVTWWQAKHDGHTSGRAGLIPSKHFQERRFALWKPITNPQKIPRKRPCKLISLFLRSGSLLESRDSCLAETLAVLLMHKARRSRQNPSQPWTSRPLRGPGRRALPPSSPSHRENPQTRGMVSGGKADTEVEVSTGLASGMPAARSRRKVRRRLPVQSRRPDLLLVGDGEEGAAGPEGSSYVERRSDTESLNVREAAASFRRSFRLSRRDRKTNKSMYECKKSDRYDTADVATYEEVTTYRRAPTDKHRLVLLVARHYAGALMYRLALGTAPGRGFVRICVQEPWRDLVMPLLPNHPYSLEMVFMAHGRIVNVQFQWSGVGPTGVGLNELKKKLLISDPQHFSVTVPHTSRQKRNQESDGVEYHFISKHLFEADIQNNKFIEYGEYKGNYYGTSLDSIRSVLAKNKVCLLDVQPHTLKHLRTVEFKPYVVFLKPPPVEHLRETRKNAKFLSGKDDKGSAKPFTEEDFMEMINTAQQMENQYGHLFDKVIVNDDLSAAFSALKVTLRKVELEAQWVPVGWTHS
ncbi:hypothetical protein P4O66_011110 [Electrophorus voltai]|uniref:MAGUK p55 subfamily member 7 n=1 Tax=Electrophorus voltai TaxID=2609070 RepID=A0AAD8Z9P2_9TELE|nr:hypothetical protein P4O66_011110 [Electrophorus voltai]